VTYKELQDEVIDFRFNEGRRDIIKRLIDRRYAMVWAAAEWPFKKMPRTALTVGASLTGLTMPADFGRALHLETSAGEPLKYYPPVEFQDNWDALDSSAGTATDYTVINGTIYVRPYQGAGASFSLAYERRVSHLADGVTATAGLMNSDNDTPIWPVEHHYLLVFGAMADGLKLENDNTWEALEDAYDQSIQTMMQDLLPPDHVGTLQYGRDLGI
jgi:hypothetical protein